ncbi:helix-turn-helix transcriptional regulator [Caenimonas aquaedulcis]|uniref:Helix-turn-helix transcriptional regulator n=1 Tax=Caenimonas aquaedulcis TaxID=2793270 RepID=A0A931MIN0_9BURK|nr:helix-turn-helix transcriptional regulator [Caenimonas aquaedulcis]MBG9390182.1 helix-turn-helix transcriptional regulator [Caenimonas aquaedulcis]
MRESELPELVDLLYEGILSAEGWSAALSRLAAVTSSQAASIVLWSRRTDQALVGDQVGLPPELMADYARHYHLLDPGRYHVDRIAVGDWYYDERELGPATMRRLPFYQEFLRKYELDSTMASPVMRTSAGLDGFLSLGSAAGRRNLPDVGRFLAPLMPHLQRAASLRVRLMELSQQVELQQEMLDRLSFPVAAVTANRAVLMANRRAQEWLRLPGNPLAASSPQAARVTAMLESACGVSGPRVAAGATVRKPAGGEYHLAAVPMPVRASEFVSPLSPVALLLVSDPDAERPHAGELFRQIFRLTPAEVRVLIPLQRGATLAETCAALHISVETGRAHLRNVFDKLGIRRQADIARVLGPIELLDPGP